jgi:hypothetical protein
MLCREYFRATEAALFSYPSILKQIRERERYLEAVACGCGGGERVQGGTAVAVQERLFDWKEGDMLLTMLKVRASHIESAIETLPSEELKRLAELRYFKRASIYDIMETLAISERVYYRMRRKVVEHCAPYVLGPFGMI